MDQKIARLRSISASYGNVSFAIGSSFQADRKNIHCALHEADEAMYADKNLFYLEHPELKVRAL